MSRIDSPQRRLFLIQSALLGFSLASGGCALFTIQQGVRRVDGQLLVDGQAVKEGFLLGPDQTVTTGPESRGVLVLGKDAFLVGADTTVRFFSGANSASLWPLLAENRPDGVVSDLGRSGVVDSSSVGTIKGFVLQAGRILSVFGRGPRELHTPTATLGIRGTGIFLQVEQEREYVCLCYGTVDIRLKGRPGEGDSLKTKHHEAPRYIYPSGPMQKAPMLNHGDDELYMLEALVNRQPPFPPSSY